MLDARDKLIRLTTKRMVDIKRVVSTKGVCPDMCPEKERLMREAKHQVASFELEDGSRTIMNHLVAVKQYSRSSADQESPLPHELRPEPVLKLTMTYLLQNIIDLCDVDDTNISDWFHFLWDRTRSIRKDITQQELCSPGSVLLVEQCARFHIHCAARLVAEEPQVFDQKINTENLTKCLQSLKYMYHDLGLKLIRCPNEAEFRAYVVLLNLHDANFLWEVKQLRPEILNSPEVRFAINVYLAMESNNYVKFFGLVRSTTYMNACILLRYFTQVRVKALAIMVKAYVVRAPITLSISNLTYVLAFEDADQCTRFLEYYGLLCDVDNDEVKLDRNTFFYPDMPFLMDRSVNVIEHKRHSSVGDAVYGAAMDLKDVLEKYEPHDSFDEHGYLLSRAWMAEDQNYYSRREMKTDSRIKSPHVAFANADDEKVFKVPIALPPSRQSISPKLRLSPKTVTTEATTNGKNGSNASVAMPSIFGGNSLASNQKSEIFKVPMTSNSNSIFSGFSTQNRETTSTSTSNLFQRPTVMPKDTLDGKQQFSSDIFSKAATTTTKADNIFSSSTNFGQNATNIFGQAKSTTSTASVNQSDAGIFGQLRSAPATNIFGGNFSVDQQSSLSDSGFKMPVSSSATIFSGFKDSFSTIAGIKPLATHTDPDAKRLEEEKELRLQQQKLKAEAEENEKEERRRRKEATDIERARKLKEIETTSAKIFSDISDEVVMNAVKEIVQGIVRHRAIEQKTRSIYADLESEVIQCELERIASDVKAAWDKNILDKYFAMWRSITRKAIEQRRKIETTPIWMPSKTMTELVSELFNPSQSESLKLTKRYLSGVSEKLVVPPMREDIIDPWSNLTPPLIKLFTSTRREQQQRSKLQLINANIYWKCVISVPDVEEDASHRTINSWLNNVFVRQLTKYPRESHCFFAEQSATDGQRINVCMRKLCGAKLMTESQHIASDNDLRGTNSILFFLTTRNLHVAHARLKELLRMTSLHDATGLVIYNMGNIEPATIQAELRLNELINFERIEHCVFSSHAQRSLADRTESCLRYIAANSFYESRLQMQQTTSLLRQCLADDFWRRIHATIEQNPTLRKAASDNKFLADYFNEAINRLISICTPSTESHAEFPDELRKFVPTHRLDIPMDLEYFPIDWKSMHDEHQRQLTVFLQSVRIRNTINIKQITDTRLLEQEILRFTRNHLPNDDRTAYKMLKQILTYLGPQPLDRISFQVKLSRYNWIDCLPVFTIDLLAARYEQSCLPEYIIYDRDEYEEYTRTAWWLSLNQDRLRELTKKVIRETDYGIDRLEQQRKRQRIDVQTLANQEQQDIEAALAKGMASLKKSDRALQAMRDERDKLPANRYHEIPFIHCTNTNTFRVTESEPTQRIDKESAYELKNQSFGPEKLVNQEQQDINEALARGMIALEKANRMQQTMIERDKLPPANQ